MSARLIADLETADAVVRAIDGVEGFETEGASAFSDGSIHVYLRRGGRRIPSLASVLGEVWAIRDTKSGLDAAVFVWRGARISVFGPAPEAGAA